MLFYSSSLFLFFFFPFRNFDVSNLIGFSQLV